MPTRIAARAALAAALLLLGALAAGQQPPAAAGRFDGWDVLREPGYAFDPDERPAFGFSVRSPPAARAALDEAEAALAAGDLETAARRLQDAVWLHGDAVVQVGAGLGRWVGVGEWALFQLLTRVPAGVRARLCAPSDRRALQEACAWRDLPRLRALALRLEGLPEGAQAAAAAARLLAERGAAAAARAAADRARLGGADEDLARLGAPAALAATAAPADPPLPDALDPLWSAPLVVAGFGLNNPFQNAAGSSEAPIAPIVPLLAGGRVIVADSLSVSAWDLLTGRRAWHHEGPLEAIETRRAQDRWFDFEIYLGTSRKRAVSPWQVAQPALADGRVVAAVQAAEPRRELNDFERIPINWPLPERRLLCLRASDGAELWRQERPALGDDAFVNRFSVAGAPLLADGAVYVAGFILEGALNAYLAAFDLSDGALLWRTYLGSGQQDLTMFNRPFQEHTPSPVLLHDGALYACTNLGLVASVDALSGRVRWLAGYEFTVRRASRSPDRDLGREVGWVNRAPQLAGGNLLVMPLDGQQLLALDPATGRTRWTLGCVSPLDATRSDTRVLRRDALVTPAGQLVVAADCGLEVLDPASGRPTFVLTLPDEELAAGPLALAGARVLQPARTGLVVADLQARQARLLPWAGELLEVGPSRRYPPRRRVVAGPLGLVVTDGWSVHAVADVAALLDDALAHAAESPARRLAAGELLLAAHLHAEAAAQLEQLLADASAPAELRESASVERLLVALAAAQHSGSADDWLALLDTAARLGRPFDHAEASLDALDELDQPAAADAALRRLAAHDPQRRLTLVARCGRDALPAGLLAALADPPGEPLELCVARQQGLIETWPDEPWHGRSVREHAAERLSRLLAEHGRAAYARWDAQAQAELAAAGDVDLLAGIEQRYPNALAVTEARRRRLLSWLEQGRADEVLRELGRSPLGGYGEHDRALRGLAAEALGEAGFAARLRGEGEAQREPPLPALPGARASVTVLELTTRSRVVFPAVNGRFGAGLEHLVLAAISGSGELVMLDGAAASVAWRRPPPISLSSVSSGYVELFADQERLLLLTYAGPSSTTDRLTALSARDGALLWSVPLPGETRTVVPCDGLLLRLSVEEGADGLRRWRLCGWGACSGTRALELDVPECEEAWLLAAGGTGVLFSVGAQTRDGATHDARLWRVDADTAELVGGEPLPADSPRLLLALDDPPTLLLSTRGATGTPELLAWDVAGAQPAWRAPVPVAGLSRTTTYPAGAGRLTLFSAVREADGTSSTLLVPVDARVGPLPPTRTGGVHGVLSGQGIGRAPRLVLAAEGQPGRLLVADGRTTERLYELAVPGSGYGSRVLHGRDAFALLQESPASGAATTLRVIAADTGAERYSVALDTPHGMGRAEWSLAEGALVLAWGGTVHVVREGLQ